MALSDNCDQPEKKPPETHRGPDKKEKLLTKVIIRRLPPSMDRETFLNQISPVPTYDYFYMVKGDASLGENSFSRAYINFSNPTDIYDFKEKFDNYVFLDSAGHEYPAVVEFSAFQKIPKKRNKARVDLKSGTIESDPYYLEFVDMINKPPVQDEKPEYSYQITNESKVLDTTTPLLEFLKNKKAEKMRIREERREDRKRKEFERKKFREDERKKRFDENSPVKRVVSPKEKIAETDLEKVDSEQGEKVKIVEKFEKEESEKFEKSTSYYNKNKDKRYDDRRKDNKGRYPPRKDYVDKREYKNRRDDYKERDYRAKYDDYNRKEGENKLQKKVKKYSERREERKMEAQKKLEQQSKEQHSPKAEAESLSESSKAAEEKPKESPEKKEECKASKSNEKSHESKDDEKPRRSKDDSQSQRRIRNKDRPTMVIYRPGMLSKRRQNDGDPENKESNSKKE